MNFLALSTGQALLLAAVTTGAVLALFFIKLRHRRVVVASSLLWQRVLDHRHALSLWEKLRRWVSLLLALTIALLIALALSRPYLGNALDAPAGPVIVVLDTSPSMEALTSSGRTRWEDATAEARRILNGSSSAAGLMVADTAGRVLTPLTEDRDEIFRAIGRMQPFGAGGKFPPVPVEDANVFFITDGVDPLDLPNSVTLLSVFEPADNVGITAFEIDVDPTSRSGYTAYLEITNYSERPKDVRIVLSGVGSRRLTQDVTLDSQQRWDISLDLVEFEGGGIRVGIQAAGDALEIDDAAYSYLPSAANNQVTLVTDSIDGYLETLLALSPRVELRVVSTSDFNDDGSGDLYVFDGFVPQEAPSLPSLLFGAAPVDWLPPPNGVGEEIRITSWLEDHPIMRSVPVYDILINQVPILDLTRDIGGHTAIAQADETPLILVSASGSRPRMVLVAFELPNSDFPIHIGFPVFVENVIAWFSGEGLAETHPLGEIELPFETTTVTALDGTDVARDTRFGRQVMTATEPGLFTALADGRRVRIAANFAAPAYSNVNQTRVDPASGMAGVVSFASNELWVYMLMVALLLVCLEWWTYNRRITL